MLLAVLSKSEKECLPFAMLSCEDSPQRCPWFLKGRFFCFHSYSINLKDLQKLLGFLRDYRGLSSSVSRFLQRGQSIEETPVYVRLRLSPTKRSL